MSNRLETVYERARIAAGLDTVGEHTDAFMQAAAEESNLADELREKCRREYELGQQEVRDREVAELYAHTQVKAEWTDQRTPSIDKYSEQVQKK